jgi:hypothetical protein
MLKHVSLVAVLSIKGEEELDESQGCSLGNVLKWTQRVLDGLDLGISVKFASFDVLLV